MSESLNIALIGIGGIGSWIIEPLYKFLRYSYDRPFSLTLIDGDEYEEKNVDRQHIVSEGNKAEVWKDRLVNRHNARFIYSVPQYLHKDNIDMILNGMRVILVAVDNHATRKLVDDYISNRNRNTLVVSGGNDITDGNVMVRYWNKRNRVMSPSFTERHNEIANPPDKNPADMSCEELAVSEPQLIITNFAIASGMLNALYGFLTNESSEYEEIYVDIVNNAVRPVQWFSRGD